MNNPEITAAFAQCPDEATARRFINGFNNARPSGRARRQLLREFRERLWDTAFVQAHFEPEPQEEETTVT